MNIPTVENIKSKKGNNTPNQFVISDMTHLVFQSYNSIIAVIDYTEKKITIGKDYAYSKTTGKYRDIFFNDYANFPELGTLNGLRKAIKRGTTLGGCSIVYDESL